MPHEYVAPDWNTYRSPAGNPVIPSQVDDNTDQAVVEMALAAMARALVLRAGQVDSHRYISFWRSASALVDVGPWQLSPRAQRLLYGIVAIQQPMVIVAPDCGDGLGLLMASGPSLGCQAIYTAQDIVGFETRLSDAARAERNARSVDRRGIVRIVPEDFASGITKLDQPIDLLILGNGEVPGGTSHGRYLSTLKAALPRMRRGALVLALGSMSASLELRQYQAFVRNTNNMPLSMNVVIDPMGYEVSVR